MPYDNRGIVGKWKGKFIKQKEKDKIAKLLTTTAGKQGERKNAELEVVSEECNTVENVDALQGRAIIEKETVAKNMWCNVCDKALSLRHLQYEKVQGLVSKWYIKCIHCNVIVPVETGKKSKGKFYDTNLKSAVGMLDAGIGETKVNTYLSALNCQTHDAKSLKRYERFVGRKIEALARKSCISAIEEEKRLTLEDLRKHNKCTGDETDEDFIVDLIASFDAAWPKKSRANNSYSGHASLMGHFGKKVMGFACRNVYCKECKMRIVGAHDCRKNYSGSSKSMEADMAVQLVLKNDDLVKAKCRIKTLIGDDDSSAIAALRRLSPYAIVKWSDFNHTAKTFNTKLYDMKINACLREYFSKVFAMSVKKNKGNEISVKVALENIIPHAFGEHQNCGSFCKLDEDETHQYKYFKDGQCLSDLSLRDRLEKIIQPFIDKTTQIAPCASSQANESFNYTVTTKHPKAFFYGGSESHCFRVAIAVCQKNLGLTFIVHLYDEMSLSPGGFTKNFRKRKEDCRSRELEHKKTLPCKRRRLFLKKSRSSQHSTQENREGLSYQSGCGYLNTSDLIDETLLIDNVQMKDCKIVVFDIETTGLAKTDEIVQIAAACGDKSFDTYMMPKKDMSEAASRVTGIQIVENEMLVNKKAVITVTPREGFISFLYFLKCIMKPCILVAHNGNSFDIPRILELAKSLNLMKELMMFVKGVCDSLHLFKCILIDRKKDKLSFKQSDLANEYLDKSDVMNAHNALNDVLVLKKLLNKICKDNTSLLIENTKSIEFILSSKVRLQKTKEYKQSLLNLTLSNQMKGKIAKAGINKAILQEAFKTGGLAGLTILLGENVNNKPRVTVNKKIIKSIYDYFAQSDETIKLPVTSWFNKLLINI